MLFKSLIMLKVNIFYNNNKNSYPAMNDINNLLRVLLLVNKKDLLFDAIFTLDYIIESEDACEQNSDFVQLFKVFCQNVFDLIKKQEPCDIQLVLQDEMKKIGDQDLLQLNQSRKIFSTYCDDAIKWYTPPQCDEKCVNRFIPLIEPKLSYICVDDKKDNCCFHLSNLDDTFDQLVY